MRAFQSPGTFRPRSENLMSCKKIPNVIICESKEHSKCKCGQLASTYIRLEENLYDPPNTTLDHDILLVDTIKSQTLVDQVVEPTNLVELMETHLHHPVIPKKWLKFMNLLIFTPINNFPFIIPFIV